MESAIPAPDVTKVALRIRRLVEECVPCELEESLITRSHSKIITRAVILAAKEAGGPEHRACVVSRPSNFCMNPLSRAVSIFGDGRTKEKGVPRH